MPAPIAELKDWEILPSPELVGRVKRDINRRTLVADGIDFSFNVMLQTFWEHLRSIIESWPARPQDDPVDEEPDHPEGNS